MKPTKFDVFAVIIVLAHASFADGIMDKHGPRGFWAATILAYAAVAAYWFWASAGGGERRKKDKPRRDWEK